MSVSFRLVDFRIICNKLVLVIRAVAYDCSIYSKKDTCLLGLPQSPFPCWFKYGCLFFSWSLVWRPHLKEKHTLSKYHAQLSCYRYYKTESFLHFMYSLHKKKHYREVASITPLNPLKLRCHLLWQSWIYISYYQERLMLAGNEPIQSPPHRNLKKALLISSYKRNVTMLI